MTEPELDSSGHSTARLYARRFRGAAESRGKLWTALCRYFFSRWIPRDSSVVDIAAGHCEFINAVDASRRFAVDLNPDIVSLAGTGVVSHVANAASLSSLELGAVDVAFASNLFEHLERPVILDVIREVHEVLRPGGRFLILQPNVRYAYRDYWMFFDHVTPIDDRALCEALEIAGFEIEKCIPRFLPYTTKSWYPTSTLLVRLYLAMPIAWRFFGAQAFIVAQKP